MRLLLILTIIPYLSLAFQVEKYIVLSKLIEKIAIVLTRKNHPKICQDGVNITPTIVYFRYAIFTPNCNRADVVVSNSFIPAFHKPFLAMSYDALLKNTNAVAGLYWLDGRYQLVFVKERLRRFGITLPKQYKPFEVSIRDLSF
ncbi:MAG: hypothetical protein ACP5LI_03725 [Hydrogenobaculum sp.]